MTSVVFSNEVCSTFTAMSSRTLLNYKLLIIVKSYEHSTPQIVLFNLLWDHGVVLAWSKNLLICMWMESGGVVFVNTAVKRAGPRMVWIYQNIRLAVGFAIRVLFYVVRYLGFNVRAMATMKLSSGVWRRVVWYKLNGIFDGTYYLDPNDNDLSETVVNCYRNKRHCILSW